MTTQRGVGTVSNFGNPGSIWTHGCALLVKMSTCGANGPPAVRLLVCAPHRFEATAGGLPLPRARCHSLSTDPEAASLAGPTSPAGWLSIRAHERTTRKRETGEQPPIPRRLERESRLDEPSYNRFDCIDHEHDVIVALSRDIGADNLT